VNPKVERERLRDKGRIARWRRKGEDSKERTGAWWFECR
jgi:hypothetical protein